MGRVTRYLITRGVPAQRGGALVMRWHPQMVTKLLLASKTEDRARQSRSD